MGKRASIAILFHESARPSKFQSYRIWHCARLWSQWGFDVQFVRGPRAPIEASLLIPHIDLSVLPEAYRPLLDSGRMVANRGVMDIRKTAFSRSLVSPHDEYDGPVIVKTNANHGGKPEKRARQRLSVHRRIALASQRVKEIARRVASAGSLSKLAYAQALSPTRYPVYQSPRHVPACAFTNPDLVVERFQPEKEGRFYYVRMYEFLGSEGLAIRVRSEQPVVKGADSTYLEFVPVDESIVALRHALGFDHGKFDYVIHGGEAVLLDVNYTPTYGRAFPRDILEQMWNRLARGITAWFPDIQIPG